MRIEITGIIGSGKSSLSKLLLEEGYGVVFEEFKLNPFWKAFYSNPNKYNFETEVTFLLQHYHDLKRRLEEENNIVCDFSFTQDLAYAVMGLTNKQLDVFRSIYNYVIEELGEPRLIIHLKCSSHEAIKRIRQRGRPEEELIDEAFLLSLNDYILKEIQNKLYKNKKIHLLEINTEKVNIISNHLDQREVIRKIKELF